MLRGSGREPVIDWSARGGPVTVRGVFGSCYRRFVLGTCTKCVRRNDSDNNCPCVRMHAPVYRQIIVGIAGRIREVLTWNISATLVDVRPYIHKLCCGGIHH